jgi:hypothetical protein
MKGRNCKARRPPKNGVILAFGSGELSVSQVDFARSVVMRRPLVFEGASFDTSVSVAGVELEAEADKTAEPETAEAQEAERSGPEPSIVSN